MPPWDRPPSSSRVCLAVPILLPCSLVNSATASVWLGMAPMKNADWALSVVPVLAMISWPLLMAGQGAVPYGSATFHIADCTGEARFLFDFGAGLNTG